MSEVLEQEVVETVPGEIKTDDPAVEEPEADDIESAEEELTPEQVAEQQEREEQERIEKSKGYRKRIDKLTFQRHEERRKREALETKYEDAIAKLNAMESEEPPKVSPTSAKPVEDQFDTTAEFLDALTDWKLEQRDAQSKANQEYRQRIQGKKEQEKTNLQQSRTFDEKRVAVMEDGLEAHEDWFEVVNRVPETIFSQEMAEDVHETSKPHEIVYYLAQNLEEAQRIADLPARQRAMELGKLEFKLEQPPKKKTSAAPAPVNPVSGAGGKPDELDPEKDPAAWIAARNAGKI